MEQTPQLTPPQTPEQAFRPSTEPLSIKEWFLTLFIAWIPLVGLIMLLVWAFDSTTNINKKNFAKAYLLWTVVGIALAILFIMIFMGAILSLVNSSSNFD